MPILFKNILPHISTIMCLEYGNYFFQKFLKKLKTEQNLSIYHFIENDFYEIASNMEWEINLMNDILDGQHSLNR